MYFASASAGILWIPRREPCHPARDAGSRKGDVKGMYFASAPAGISGFRIKCGMTKTGIPGSRIGVRDDQITASGYSMTKARSPVRPMGESGKKNSGEGRTREKMFEPR